MRVGRCLTLVVAFSLAAAAGSSALDRPLTVSPGGTTGVEISATLCPAFSWAGVEGATGYEIVIYELADAAGGARSVAGRPPTLGVTVRGAALSWTPSADRCLDAGTSYVWFVRALLADETDSEWSDGGMFRTPTAEATSCRPEEILRIVQRYLETPSAARLSAWQEIEQPAAIESGAPARSFTSMLRPTADISRAPTPAGVQAFKAEQPDASGIPAYGVFGISSGSFEGSAGVVGYAEATSGEVGGVAGYNDSVQGFGVFGQNSGTTGGVGVMGRDEAASGITGGVVGISANDEGYGGFFWNEGGGDPLVVADPTLHPASVDVKLFVDVDGNLGLEGVVTFAPTDTPTEGCLEATEGSVYYDDSASCLCVCTKISTGPDTYGYRRVHDPTTGCL